MNIDIFKAFAGTIVLLAAQVLVLNNIHLFGCATPLLLVYVIIIMPWNTPRWVTLLTGFTLGVISDIFSNTPGVAAAALTAIAFVQPFLLKLFISREASESMSPSIKTIGHTGFMSFSFVQVLLFCTIFFILEEFNFLHFSQLALFVGGSTILTFLLLLTIENFR